MNEREMSQDHVYSLKTNETMFTHVFGLFGWPGTVCIIYIYIYTHRYVYL